MTFAAPSFLWLLLGLPLLVLLHVIRRQRKQTVSSLFLWHKAQHVTALQRRIRPSWLLLVQLLAYGVLVLALAQPMRQGEGEVARALIIDASASMRATSHTQTRLGSAKATAGALIRDSHNVLLLRAGLEPTLIHPLSTDQRSLLQNLDTLEAGDASADLAAALALAKQVLPEGEIHLFSDRSPDISLDNVTLHSSHSPATNIGITRFSAEGNRLFVSLLNSSATPISTTLTLYADAQQVASHTLRLDGKRTTHTSFQIANALQVQGYRVGLEPPIEDALRLDNEAWLAYRNLRVLIAPNEPDLLHTFEAIPYVEPRRALRPSGAFELLVTPDTFVPDPLTSHVLSYPPPQSQNTISQVLTWQSTHPLLRFVDLTAAQVILADSEPVGEVLVSDEALRPVVSLLEQNGYIHLRLHVHPSQTDITRRSAWPILMANLTRYLHSGPNLPLGTVIAGERLLTPSLLDGPIPSSVNLLSTAESSLHDAPPLTALPPVSSAAFGSPPPLQSHPLTPWLIALGLLLLATEWSLWRWVNR